MEFGKFGYLVFFKFKFLKKSLSESSVCQLISKVW